MAIPRRPTKLGPYDVIAKIASGGMAHVYLGRGTDLVGDGRLAAIKIMRHDFGGDEQALHMFLDEARLLSRLSHPNIIQTLEFGTTDEHPFIAMELLLGRTVLDVWEACVAEQMALRFDLAAYVAARVAEALDYAHLLTDELGTPLHLIHRDVNPSNIFLTFDGKVKLFDFGLAKAKLRRTKSHAGIVKGKLPYLSPEQVMELPLDRRSDVYTLGTTLWEMATMRRLFKRGTDIDTVRAVRSAAIPRPETLVEVFPEPLSDIIIRSLERNREHRYQSAQEFADALDDFIARSGSGDPSTLIPATLDRLFPGERARQMGWLKSAVAPNAALMRATLTPPIPIPIQSSVAPLSRIPESGGPRSTPTGPLSAPPLTPRSVRDGPLSTPLSFPLSTPPLTPRAPDTSEESGGAASAPELPPLPPKIRK